MKELANLKTSKVKELNADAIGQDEEETGLCRDLTGKIRANLLKAVGSVKLKIIKWLET